MKRSTPLQRGTPLERFGRLRRRSAKTAKVYRERSVLVARLLLERPECEAGPLIETVAPRHVCAGLSEHVHEVLTRARGGSILDESNCMAVCHRCHAWAHGHPREAHELGLLKASWEAS